MNEGSESNTVLTPEQELLREGCASYLDVIHATNAFQTRIGHAARDVINAARDQISSVAKLDKPLQASAQVYVYPALADNDFDGSEAWIGATIWLDRPVHALLYLALVFHYPSHSDQQTPHVCFALQARQIYIVDQLGKIFAGHKDCQIYKNWEWRGVQLRWPLGNPLSVREELTTTLDNALTQWNNHSNNATANHESA